MASVDVTLLIGPQSNKAVITSTLAPTTPCTNQLSVITEVKHNSKHHPVHDRHVTCVCPETIMYGSERDSSPAQCTPVHYSSLAMLQ